MPTASQFKETPVGEQPSFKYYYNFENLPGKLLQ
jgi:hypothetical protein